MIKKTLKFKELESDIIELLNKNRLSFKKIERPKGGVVNEVYFLDNEYVLRINTRDKQLKKFENEYKIITKLWKKGLPVPKPILFAKIKGFEVLITQKLKGKPLSHEEFGSEKIRNMTKPLAKTLRSIHKVTSTYFGTFDHRFKKWTGYYIYSLNRNIRKAKIHKSLDSKTISLIKKAVNRHKKSLNEVKNKSLVHRDYSFSNILCVNKKIAGVLDFEWSIYGDFVYDFSILELAVNGYPKLKKVFEKEYGKLPKNFDIRNELCKLHYLSELITVDKIFWNSSFRKEMLRQIEEVLNKLE